MGWAVLAEEDRVMGPYPHRWGGHQSGETDRGPHVVAEDEEGRGIGLEPAVDRHPVGDASHGVLPDPKWDVPRRPITLRVAAFGVDHGLGRGDQIGRAADEPGDLLGDLREQLARRRPRGHLLADTEPGALQLDRGGRVQPLPEGAFVFVCALQAVEPSLSFLFPPGHGRREELVDLGRHMEGGLHRKSHGLLRQGDLLVS